MRETIELTTMRYAIYLDVHPVIIGGRELWGFPKKRTFSFQAGSGAQRSRLAGQETIGRGHVGYWAIGIHSGSPPVCEKAIASPTPRSSS